MKFVTSLLVTGFLAAACAAAPAAQSPSSSPTAVTAAPAASATPAAATPTEEPTPELPDLIGDVPEDVLLEIMQETANVTGLNLGELTLERAEAVIWPDASLGCPREGQSYIQVLTDGYWVVIEAGGDTYDIRVDQQGNWDVCPPGLGQPPVEEQF